MTHPADPHRNPHDLPAAPPVNPGEQAPLAQGKRAGFGSALLAALVWVPVNFVIALLVAGAPSAEQAGAFIGASIVPAVLAGLVTWLIAKRSTPAWAFWKLVLLALPFYLLVRLLLASASTGA
ncbi:hypothetical protein ACFS2C_23665 [Prauserella oleivorans]|uniref:Integral membrane protein n=1 Tax=Prauserella oleivorans TaxID=1478153 RepID=A0ABW5WJ00_9PSEU